MEDELNYDHHVWVWIVYTMTNMVIPAPRRVA
jgi:hypothetical protein